MGTVELGAVADEGATAELEAGEEPAGTPADELEESGGAVVVVAADEKLDDEAPALGLL